MPDGSEAEGQALRKRIPMYYNLCGCVEKPSTLVLDYDDLFRPLEGMLGALKLPEKLLARLKDTTSYLSSSVSSSAISHVSVVRCHRGVYGAVTSHETTTFEMSPPPKVGDYTSSLTKASATWETAEQISLTCSNC